MAALARLPASSYPPDYTPTNPCLHASDPALADAPSFAPALAPATTQPSPNNVRSATSTIAAARALFASSTPLPRNAPSSPEGWIRKALDRADRVPELLQMLEVMENDKIKLEENKIKLEEVVAFLQRINAALEEKERQMAFKFASASGELRVERVAKRTLERQSKEKSDRVNELQHKLAESILIRKRDMDFLDEFCKTRRQVMMKLMTVDQVVALKL